MKEEIKEILDFLDDDNRERPFGISNHDLKILRDYITNLQEENEKVHKELDYADNYNIYLISKIEKAIEELDKYINSCEIEAEHTLNNEKCLISVRHSKKVKNILKGDKDE